MEPDSGPGHRATTPGHMPPRFFFGGGGVAHVPAFLPRPKRPGRFKVANHSGMREIEESGFAAFLV